LVEIVDQVGEAARLQASDAATWEALYERVFPAMLAYAERRLGIGEDARDAVSEALTRAVAGVDRLAQSKVAPEAWFFGILRHVVLDQHRRNYRHRRAKASRDIVEGEPLEKIVIEEEGVAMRAAFEQLRERDREVLELRVVARLSAEDTASVLGMRPGAVRTAQARALTRLRAILAEAEWASA
jgi:RNA polymerase sigma-70 factor (ECF subfamily)